VYVNSLVQVHVGESKDWQGRNLDKSGSCVNGVTVSQNTTNARMVTTTKNMASIVLVCLILLGLTDFSESQGTESFNRVHHQMGGSSRLPGMASAW